MLKRRSKGLRIDLAAAAATLGLMACGGEQVRAADAAADAAAPAPAAEAIIEVSYTCADGRRIEARYDNTRPGQSSARLQIDGRRFEMYHVVSGSGARYATESGMRPGHGLQWWSKGDEATLSEMVMDHTAPGPVVLTTCSAARRQ